MKATTRLRFLFGILCVIALSAGLFLYLEYSMARIHSVEAHINSDSYTVGMEYSSIVEKQYVAENAFVKVNDPLFELRSPSLAEAIRDNAVAQTSLLYAVTPQGTVLVRATAAGRVQTISRRVGDFVPANSTLATINLKDGLYVKAMYKLAAPDYARIGMGSRIAITLPDGIEVDGTVYDISLATVDKQVYTTVKARIDQSKVNKVVFTVGTPVESILYLDNDTWATRLMRFVTQLFQPSGK